MQSMCVIRSLILLLNLVYSSCLIQLAPIKKPLSGVALNAFKRGPYTSSPKAPSSGIDGRSVKDGSIVEYLSAKGSKRLAIVNKRKGPELEVLNNALMEFSVSVSKVTYLIEGLYNFEDLTRLTNALTDQKLEQVQELRSSIVEGSDSPVTIELVSQNVFGSTNKIDMYLSMKLMEQFGNVFFKESSTTDGASGDKNDLPNSDVVYVPLPSETVQGNLKHRSDLEEFRSEFIRVMTSQAPKSGKVSEILVMDPQVLSVLEEYSEGLKQMIAKSHPWVVNSWCAKTFNDDAAAKGKELLEYLELSPVSKNAKKVLEIAGVWPMHTNIDKYVMGIRDVFPAEVLGEAESILLNSEGMADPDELQRVDLTHLKCYAIDSEDAAEVRHSIV
jgi:exoribonuclease II